MPLLTSSPLLRLLLSLLLRPLLHPLVVGETAPRTILRFRSQVMIPIAWRPNDTKNTSMDMVPNLRRQYALPSLLPSTTRRRQMDTKNSHSNLHNQSETL